MCGYDPAESIGGKIADSIQLFVSEYPAINGNFHFFILLSTLKPKQYKIEIFVEIQLISQIYQLPYLY